MAEQHHRHPATLTRALAQVQDMQNLASDRELLDLGVAEVSKWTVGMQLEHMVLVDERILDALEKVGKTEESKGLRKELKGAFAQIENDGLEDLVLNKVSEQFREIAKKQAVRDDPDRLGMAEVLPPLLRDEAFRVPLMKDGGVVSRYHGLQ